jgi:hypothetical protein
MNRLKCFIHAYVPINRFTIATLFVLATVLLIPRLVGFHFFAGEYLWTEDGNIFLNQAQSLGVASLWHPYNGYLHAYPRLIAFCANYFELVSRPFVFLVGWYLAYLFMFLLLILRAKELGASFYSLVFLVTLVSLQPNYGENFFNITNAQWLLATGLSVLILTISSEPFRITFTRFVFLLLMGLTGPFSIILIPVLALKAFLQKDVKNNAWIFITLLGCALVQIYCLVNSGRAATGGINTQFWVWMTALFRDLLFGANKLSTIVAAVVFWTLLLTVIIDKYRVNKITTTLTLPATFLCTAVLFILAGLYTNKSDPMTTTALGDGNRYTWIPFVLIVFCAILVSSQRRVIQVSLFGLAMFICYIDFHHTSLPNSQFKSFANFANYKEVTIPINPIWMNSMWYINGIPFDKKPLNRLYQVELDSTKVVASGAEIKKSLSGIEVESNSNDPSLILPGKFECTHASDFAVEIELTRSKEGWMQLFWNNTSNFTELNSMRRWYPAGLVKAQFAFPNIQDGVYLRFDPLEIPGHAEISKITAYCLP